MKYNELIQKLNDEENLDEGIFGKLGAAFKAGAEVLGSKTQYEERQAEIAKAFIKIPKNVQIDGKCDEIDSKGLSSASGFRIKGMYSEEDTLWVEMKVGTTGQGKVLRVHFVAPRWASRVTPWANQEED